MSNQQSPSATTSSSSSASSSVNRNRIGTVVTNGITVAQGASLQNNTQGNYANYEVPSATGYGTGGGEVLAGGNDGYYSSYYGGLDQQGLAEASLVNVGGLNSSSVGQQSSSFGSYYAADAQGLYQDPNPEFIRRPAQGNAQTYTQRVLVRFLQPPPVPAPGPLIIKEVRPPQPPAPPPLYIRQRPPPPPVLPPLVIREAPPRMPPPVPTKLITRMLPPLPVPPRSVIIERLPPLPPKPRDIVVERWLPYRVQQKRRVIIQRAPPAVVQKPRNIIIYYEPTKAQVVRRFENLGVQMVNPADYVARYGTQLEDAQTLLTHARQAGVVEDISPPAVATSGLQSSGYEYYQSGGVDLGAITANSYGSSSSYTTVGGINDLNSTVGGYRYGATTANEWY